jgi:hypothetical protein|tara:strand:- start:262 stop:525 length:264 start_codon:yes stop_codon:yes gene_type:complete
MKDFSNDATLAQLQGISVELGDIFARTYRDRSAKASDVDDVLEAYKAVRRCLPREDEHPDNRHIGRKAAHAATQGDLISRVPSQYTA